MEIEALLASMDEHLAHTPRRVIHTDPFTPLRSAQPCIS